MLRSELFIHPTEHKMNSGRGKMTSLLARRYVNVQLGNAEISNDTDIQAVFHCKIRHAGIEVSRADCHKYSENLHTLCPFAMRIS